MEKIICVTSYLSRVSFEFYPCYRSSPLLIEQANRCFIQHCDRNASNAASLSKAHYSCSSFGTGLKTADSADQKLLRFSFWNFREVHIKGLPNSERPRCPGTAPIETQSCSFESHQSCDHFGYQFYSTDAGGSADITTRKTAH